MIEPTAKSRFKPNIGRKGRIIRGAGALVVFGIAIATTQIHLLLTIALLVLGIFMLFEALQGWCALRACKIRTPF